MEIKGKALVTGASSGIGRETAIKLAKEGFQVITVARRKERLDELSKQYPNIVPRIVDLSDSQALDEFSKELSSL